MSNVVVVGGGLSGAASAVRLAKMGHTVTLLEKAHRVGGALVPVEQRGYSWSLTGDAFSLPATLRDLFKKSGRRLDRELELNELSVLREHRFADGTRVALPGQSRTGVTDALEELGKGLSSRWLAWTDSYSETWELLRRHALERRYSETYAPRALNKLLTARTSLSKATRPLRDARLREMALFHALSNGQRPDETPGWYGFLSYVEQTFGAWSVPGGPAEMVALLERRLRERGVDIRTNTTVTDVASGGVYIGDEVLEADAVIVACDPHSLPALSRWVAKSIQAPMPELYLLAVEDARETHPHQVVLHLPGALVTVDTTGPGPEPGKAAWTVAVRGQLAIDVRQLLSGHGLTQFNTVVRRLSPEDQLTRFGGSPYGVQWHGRKTPRLDVRTPIPGVFAAGAHTTISPSMPFVALTSSLIAAEFETVPRVSG